MTTSATEFQRYAIFKNGGKQYQAIEGKTVQLEKLAGEVGEQLELKGILFRKLEDGKFEVGKPELNGSIKVSIVKHMLGEKITVFKFKRRKKSRVKRGHRQPGTVVRIESIV